MQTPTHGSILCSACSYVFVDIFVKCRGTIFHTITNVMRATFAASFVLLRAWIMMTTRHGMNAYGWQILFFFFTKRYLWQFSLFVDCRQYTWLNVWIFPTKHAFCTKINHDMALRCLQTVTAWGLIYQHGFTLVSVWITNLIPSKVWDEIAYPFLNFNGGTVWQWIKNFI